MDRFESGHCVDDESMVKMVKKKQNMQKTKEEEEENRIVVMLAIAELKAMVSSSVFLSD